jgi:class 3 adenylate cyclase/tetratricopeptide (TPR) repeat protein
VTLTASGLDWRRPRLLRGGEPASSVGTFLFTDVEGSTRLLERLGEERYGTAIATHDRLLREAFARGGGVEANSQGDSFFFVFADAHRAVLAALDAQRALGAEHWAEESPIKVRIGMHTGRAALHEGKLVGLAVHRAARIANAAHGGQVLLSDTTAEDVKDATSFRLRDLGDYRLKDFERPLRLYQLVADDLEVDFPPLRALSQGMPQALTGKPAGGLSFIGRERELGILRTALQDVLSGAGRIALLEGEAGIGKSRLALELGHAAAECGVALVWGTCVEGGGAPTLWPWIEIVRAVVDRAGDDEDRALPPELETLLSTPSSPPPPSPTSPEARFSLYASVARLLEKTSARQPLLVVLDDIHWADVPTLELLQTLALEVVSTPLFLLATYREHEPGTSERFEQTLTTVARYPWTRRVLLRGLPADAVAEMVRDTTDVDLRPALVAVVHARTQGNPFFVAELVRLLAAEPDIERESVLATGIPLGVRDVVRQRLLLLPAETQKLLQLAAVIGEAFDFRLLAKASDANGRECAERLEQALSMRTIVEAEACDFRFSHGLVRETIIDDLTPLRRARLHADVADALLAEEAPNDDVAEIVADHVWHARQLVEPQRAVAALERASGVALQRHAYDTADRQLERALEIAGGGLVARERDETELRLELELASVRMMTQGWAAPSVLEGFDRAAEIARRSGNLVVLVKSLHGIASGLSVGGHFRDSLTAGEACLTAARGLDDPLALALGHHVVGIGHMHLGHITEARREFRACMNEYERSQPEAGEAFDIAVPISLAGPVFGAIAEELGGDTEQAARLSDRAIAAADQLGTPFAQQVAMFFCAWLATLEDDPHACQAYIARGEATVGEHLFPIFDVVSPLLSTWAAGRLGDDEAVGRLEAMLQQLEAVNMKALSHYFHGLHADLLAAQGQLESALTSFERSIAVSEASGECFYLAELLRRRGDLLVRLGRDREGRAELRRALVLARDQGAGGAERRTRETLSALER